MATSGVSLLVSPKSYAKCPRVSVGHAAGSQARTSISRPAIFSRRNGNASPAKFEPPPTQPITTSGNAPASSSCASASCPITVWWSSTWLRTLPSEYAVSSRPAASSTASEIAMPRLPGESGCSSRIARPDCVSSDGLGTISAPHVWIIERRLGFCS
jgi:hypothetical protein